MSDHNSNRKTTARQDNQSSYHDLMRAHAGAAGHHAVQGFTKSAGNYTKSISTTGPAQSTIGTAGQVGSSVAAGGKEWGKAAAHTGKAVYYGAGAFIEGLNRQFPNSGQQLNNINPSIAQERANANLARQNSGYTPKANQMNQPKANQPTVNKGIEAYRQKAAANQSKTNTGQSTNKGIISYQNKVNGQSAGSTTKGANESGSQSNRSSKGR